MSLSPELQKRAADFRKRTLPTELEPNYVSGSLAEVFIALGAEDEPLDPELCEMAEMAEMAASEYDAVIADAKTPELKSYYSDCQQLVRDLASHHR
ncbi:MAG: hypothetical protein V4662_14245 [Verrucomicrobiota bacterium]